MLIPDDSYQFAQRLGLHRASGPKDHPADDPENLCDQWHESRTIARRCVRAPPHDAHNAGTGVTWVPVEEDEE